MGKIYVGQQIQLLILQLGNSFFSLSPYFLYRKLYKLDFPYKILYACSTTVLSIFCNIITDPSNMFQSFLVASRWVIVQKRAKNTNLAADYLFGVSKVVYLADYRTKCKL